jgi:glycosyltransferase involved in cell wall biosynthesis
MEPHFALCFNGRLSGELNGHDVPLYDLGQVRARNLVSVRKARKRLAEILEQQRIDVAICHAVWSQVIFGTAIQKSGVRQVFWQHDAMTGHGWLGAAATLVPPDFVVSNSFYSASTLIGNYPRIPRSVVRYPLELASHSDNLEVRQTIRRQLGTPQDATVIVQLSRLEPYKGHEHHLKALARLKEIPNWECWMVGGPRSSGLRTGFVFLVNAVTPPGCWPRQTFTVSRMWARNRSA